MRLTLASFAVWIACIALRFARPAPLEHDEARYALSARARRSGEHRWLYVPRGMDVIAELPILLRCCP